MNYKKVIINWIDSKGVDGQWHFKNELKPMRPVKIQSLGFLVDDHKDYKTIAQSDSEDQVCGLITIPTSAIKKIKIIDCLGRAL